MNEEIENCIKRQNEKIYTVIEINNKKLEFEQRLITKKEYEEYSNILNNSLGSEKLFEIRLKEEKLPKKNNGKLDFSSYKAKDLFELQQATEELKNSRNKAEYFLIEKSLTKNIFYGGFFKIDGFEVKKENIKEYIESLEAELLEKLFINAEKLSIKTEVEVKEVK